MLVLEQNIPINSVLNWFNKMFNTKFIVTSHIRKSPTHYSGYSYDIAPVHFKHYAGTYHRNPFLNLRPSLFNYLLKSKENLKNILEKTEYSLLLVIEDDHFHCSFYPKDWIKSVVLIKKLRRLSHRNYRNFCEDLEWVQRYGFNRF